MPWRPRSYAGSDYPPRNAARWPPRPRAGSRRGSPTTTPWPPTRNCSGRCLHLRRWPTAAPPAGADRARSALPPERRGPHLPAPRGGAAPAGPPRPANAARTRLRGDHLDRRVGRRHARDGESVPSAVRPARALAAPQRPRRGVQRGHPCRARRGGLGAVPIDANGSSPPVTAYIAAKFNQHLATLARADHVFTLRDFYSGNFSMRRERFLEVGLLDEAFERYGNEDLELWLRLSRAGIQLKYEAEALARQYYTKSFSELSRDTISKGRTAVLLASKHPEAFAHLKLATFHQASYKWRLARAALLGLSATLPPTPAWVIRLVELVERRRPRRLWVLYDFVLDYCYWLGARLALRESRLRETGA